MTIIQLRHDPRLAYAAAKNLSTIPAEVLAAIAQDCIITFRNTEAIKPHLLRNKLNGCSRFLDFPSGDLVFYGVESDSPLAPLILWDAAHRLPVGARITLIDLLGRKSYLQRDYFKTSFVVEHSDEEQMVFRKIAPLLAEQDAGLNRWSFCIPTGPGDATGLNIVVKRILELDVPEKEILLCGRPDKNFLYWDHVRIIGENIPAPPVWITRKKNELAKEARFENLCILHDRVFLPANFISAVREFGDFFPFTGFQSLWFDDIFNLSPVRYSDYCCASEVNVSDIVSINKSGRASAFESKLFAEIEKQNFHHANPLRYQQSHYLTGSLYIVKRNVWLHTPQNEDLYWAEFEDIEQARRCELSGIPHRIIPGAFTQSLFARPILYPAGYSSCFLSNGKTQLIRKTIPLPSRLQKPLIKMSAVEANKRLIRFSLKYCKEQINHFADNNHILFKIFSVVYAAKLPFRESEIRNFVDDVERDLLCDQISYTKKTWLVNQFIQHRALAKINFCRYFKELSFQFCLRPQGRRFYHSILEYFPARNQFVKVGSWISAIRLARLNGNFLYHPQGWRGYYHAILASTPFSDYTEFNQCVSSPQPKENKI